jgi:hypothetical protein
MKEGGRPCRSHWNLRMIHRRHRSLEADGYRELRALE